MENIEYFNGLNEKLFLNIPISSINILELGCANGLLGFAYKQKYPNVNWTGIDINENAVMNSNSRLDRVLLVDLNTEKLSVYFKKNEFNTIVIGDLLEHLLDPQELISQLRDVTNDNSTIICCIPNMVNIQVLEKIITGDMTYDDNGLLDKTHQRFFSLPSAFKMFLDNGFIPELVDQYNIQLTDTPFIRGVVDAANSIGVPLENLIKNLSRYQMIIRADKIDNEINEDKNLYQFDSISVVVKKRNQQKLNENILKSPGLKEINAQIIVIDEVDCAAELFEAGKNLAINEWILILSDSCYLPKGSGFLMLQKLSEINTTGPVGFHGFSLTNQNHIEMRGVKITEDELITNGMGEDIIAMDDFAVFLNKNSPLKIDPLLGWHNFATDLCIQAFLNDEVANGKVLNIPIFSNEYYYQEAAQFQNSSNYLKEKWKNLPKIETMKGTLINE